MERLAWVEIQVTAALDLPEQDAVGVTLIRFAA
jgi:hypothetical protein